MAIVPEQSYVAEVIRRTGTGYVIPSEQDWADGLESALRQYLRGDLPKRNEAAIQEFSWENVSKKWLEVITGQAVPNE